MSRIADRILETSTSTGTATFNLIGATTGFKAFRDDFATGLVVFYVISLDIVDSDGNITDVEWEIGYGTLTHASPDTLTRNVLRSSNSDALTDFSAGTKNVFNAPPGEMLAGFVTTNKSATRPAWALAGTFWIDDTSDPTWDVYFYDGAADIQIGQIDATNNFFTPYRQGTALGTAAVLANNEGTILLAAEFYS